MGHMALLPDFILYAMKTKSLHIPTDIQEVGQMIKCEVLLTNNQVFVLFS
jgi:hypothetical protein